MVKIRLRRDGAKKSPYYTIVVADSRYPADGRFIEKVGTYNPMVEPAELKVDSEKVLEWIKKGAYSPSGGNARLRARRNAVRWRDPWKNDPAR